MGFRVIPPPPPRRAIFFPPCIRCFMTFATKGFAKLQVLVLNMCLPTKGQHFMRHNH